MRTQHSLKSGYAIIHRSPNHSAYYKSFNVVQIFQRRINYSKLYKFCLRVLLCGVAKKSSHLLLQESCFENFNKFTKNKCDGVYFQKRFISTSGKCTLKKNSATAFLYRDINHFLTLKISSPWKMNVISQIYSIHGSEEIFPLIDDLIICKCIISNKCVSKVAVVEHIYSRFLQEVVKNTHMEKAPSDKTRTLTKSMNMDICVIGTLN